jgi:hypothetical protein
MHRGDARDPFAAFTTPGRGYAAYLHEMRAIYEQIGALMRPAAVAIVEVANLREAEGITPLAWDMARVIGQVLAFQGEIIIGWTPTYGEGYDHSYCLIFKRRA